MRLTGDATVLLAEDVVRSLAYGEALGFERRAWEVDPRTTATPAATGATSIPRLERARPRPDHAEAPPDMFDADARVDDVEALHEELLGRGADPLHGPVDQDYRLRELRVRDPDGYVLACGTRRS